jgi:Na+-translocating ferredoxin:NAD+ oxidoreductase RnfG subunit
MKINIKSFGLNKVVTVLLSLILVSFTFPKKYDKKIRKYIKEIYGTETFDVSLINYPDSISIKVISADNFYKISADNKTIGFVILDKTPSKFSYFNYIVFLDKNLAIKSVKILTYREEHGDEIMSKRWLKQFFGLQPKDQAVLNKNIDGISGATISVKSLTTRIDLILKDLKKIKDSIVAK